ncbi:hypothetical protein MMC17_000597 [Xylographa soralifera]|nr:hypothetical protein [Xylographa soralifera]
MKLILTGATGFIGAEVLRQCLLNPSITSLVALTRRPLSVENPKLTTIIMNDFTSYTDEVIQQLAGAESCIWALGGRGGTTADLRRVEVDYTMAAATAFTTSLAPMLPERKKFRFVYLSGMISETNQEKPLWYAQNARRLKGEVENRLAELGQHSNVLETYMVKPGMVLAKDSGYMASNPLVAVVMGNVKLDELAAVMVETALSGNRKQTLEYNDLQAQGRILTHKESCCSISKT